MHQKSRKLMKLGLVLLAMAVLGGAVTLLWNAVMPGLFPSALAIDYWHGLGLLALCRILFGGFYGHAGHRMGEKWQRWQAMTEEERAQFRRQRGGFCKPGEERA